MVPTRKPQAKKSVAKRKAVKVKLRIPKMPIPGYLKRKVIPQAELISAPSYIKPVARSVVEARGNITRHTKTLSYPNEVHYLGKYIDKERVLATHVLKNGEYQKLPRPKEVQIYLAFRVALKRAKKRR